MAAPLIAEDRDMGAGVNIVPKWVVRAAVPAEWAVVRVERAEAIEAGWDAECSMAAEQADPLNAPNPEPL
jgi:hypothetical protein